MALFLLHFLVCVLSLVFVELDEIIDEETELDRESLAIGEMLGEGAFGVVVKAEALGLAHKTEKQFVAVKMLKGM